VFRNSYTHLTWSFKSVWSRVSFMVEVVTIVDSLLRFLGACCSGSMFTAPVDSAYISVNLSGAKKLRVNITSGGSFSAANVGTG
jgi:hypothetical protein